MISDAGRVVLELVESCGRVGSDLAEIVERACIRLLDSRMIVEGKLRERKGDGNAAAQSGYPIGDIPGSGGIGLIIERALRDGIGPHFSSLVTYFFLVLMSSTKNRQLVEELDGMIRRGRTGCFLMTDRGGPSIGTWLSRSIVQDGSHDLRVDKLHGLNADRCDFAAVVVRSSGSMFPAVYMLSERKYACLDKLPAGGRWFDGQVQLGNVKGDVSLSENDMITGGGLAPVAKFLSICRPRLVRVALSHVRWLAGQGRLVLSGHHENALSDMSELSEAQMKFDLITAYNLDRVHALKLAFNELLLDIVLGGTVRGPEDKRDLLGFTKMEGSSYRCFLEIMAKRMAR